MRNVGVPGSFARDLARYRPIRTDALKILPTEITPPNLCAAIDANPIDAMHPQDAQSGFPPNWHGVIFVRRSADNV